VYLSILWYLCYLAGDGGMVKTGVSMNVKIDERGVAGGDGRDGRTRVLTPFHFEKYQRKRQTIS
jgi:hypothetical protein